MHDFGTLVWVIIVIIGVVSSITRGARRNARQAGRAFAPQPYAQPNAPPQPVRSPAPQPVPLLRDAPVQRPVRPPVAVAPADMGPLTLPVFDAPPERKVHRWRRLLANRSSIQGSIVAAQIFGPPLALGGTTDRLW